MNRNRRRFVQAGLAGGVGLAAGAIPLPAAAGERKKKPRRDMDVLILGGTGFIGPHMVRECLRRGHKVSLFNRGRSNPDMFPDLPLYVGDRNNNLDSLKGRTWDVVIDNSGYVPRHVADSARLLNLAVAQYLYVSSVSAYADFAIPNHEGSPTGTLDDEDTEEVTGTTYGPLKALCENPAAFMVGSDQ